MNIFWYMIHDRISSTSKKSICLFIAFSFGGWGGERAVKRGDWGADQWWPWLPREVSSYSFRLNICFVGGISKQIFITFEKFPLKINSLHCQQSIWPTTGTLGRQQTASSSRKEETYQLLKWYIASTKFNGNTNCKNPLWLSVSLFCQVLPLAYRATHSQTGAVCVFMEDISLPHWPAFLFIFWVHFCLWRWGWRWFYSRQNSVKVIDGMERSGGGQTSRQHWSSLTLMRMMWMMRMIVLAPER